MSARPAKRVKHIPQRTCVGCREVLPKRTLVRLVRLPEGVRVDLSGKLAGRGAYLHNRPSCWENGLKGGLARALKVNLSPEDRAALSEFAATLPPDEPNEASPTGEGAE